MVRESNSYIDLGSSVYTLVGYDHIIVYSVTVSAY